MLRRRRAAQLPYDLVASKVAYAAAAEEAIGDLALTRVKDNVFVRHLSDGHVAVCAARGLKGKTVELQWGVSLSYVPHSLVPRLAWHRTVKGSRLDLWTTSQRFFARPSDGWIPALHGEAHLREVARAVGRSCRPAMEHFWREASSAEGVLVVAQRQMNDEHSIHHPSPGFIASFALARLGRLQEAEEMLRAVRLDDAERTAAASALTSVTTGA